MGAFRADAILTHFVGCSEISAYQSGWRQGEAAEELNSHTYNMPMMMGMVSSLFRKSAVLLGLVFGVGLTPSCALATDNPLWFDKGRPNAEAGQAVKILLSAASDGLEPEDYEAEGLARAIASAEREQQLPADALVRLEMRLTEAMIRYLSDLHFGRIDPRQITANFIVPSPAAFDPGAHLRAAVAGHRLLETVRQAEPAIPLYTALRKALADYRVLAIDPAVVAAWEAGIPTFSGRKLEPGREYGGTALLAWRLALLGDFPQAEAVPVGRYEGVLVEGVKSFQLRHGLEADGVIGKQTLAQLDISPAGRVRQIELALERLRWTPLLLGPRMVVVNIPEFTLRAYEIVNSRVEIKLVTKVIVGQAVKRQTPLFNMEMRYIEFSPYWNVPPSIAREEIIPRLKRDPAYFQQQDFEFLDDKGRTLADLSEANLLAVRQGKMRIRQRPGPKNSLGNIKFVFPNDDNIYLHDTPARLLFLRGQRDFSHGCIRVQDPVALAKFVLENKPEWTDERIQDAMKKGTSSTLRLEEPLPVVIAYITSIARKDGRVYFLPDLYDKDRQLDDALRRRSFELKRLRQNNSVLEQAGTK